MNNSYKMRMYRRHAFVNRYLIGGIAWGVIAYLVTMLVLFT
jgi:hypothetical protein